MSARAWQWGRAGNIAAGSALNHILQWKQDCDEQGETLPPEVMSVSVSFDVLALAAPAATDSSEAAVLTLSWGCNGAWHAITADIGRGVRVNVPAQHIDVGINYPVTAGIQQPDLAYRVTIARGAVVIATSELRRTINFGAVGAGVTSAAVAVPAFARYASLENATDAFASATLVQATNADAAATVLDRAPITKAPRSVDIKQGATHARVINNSNGAETIRVVFYLGIG